TVCSRRKHYCVTFFHKCSISQSGIRPRQACDARELAGHRQSRSAEEATGDFAQRYLTINPKRQLFREAFFGQSPQVCEFGLINHLGGYDDHCGLKLIERKCERFPILQAGFLAEVSRSHLPLLAQYSEHSKRTLTKTLLLVASGQTPKRIEVRDHPRSQEHRFSANQLAEIHTAASEDFIFQCPRMRGFRILLNVPRDNGITPATYGNV